MEQRPYAARFASMDWESPAPKVRRKLHRVGNRQLRVVEFEKGLEHPEWCRAGHVGYLLQGRLAHRVTISGSRFLIIGSSYATHLGPRRDTPDRILCAGATHCLRMEPVHVLAAPSPAR